MDFKEEASEESEGSTEPLLLQMEMSTVRSLRLLRAVDVTFTPKKKEESFDRKQPQAFGHGFLSVEQANLILNQLPMEITFVNKDDIFQYYNDAAPFEEDDFKRTPSQVGRNVELCHPPKYLEKVKPSCRGFVRGKKDKYEMWFKSESRGKFVHVTYAAVRDEAGDFQGVLEYVQDIQPYREIDTDFIEEWSKE